MNHSLRVERASAKQLLARILDDPSLVASIQNLSPSSLGKLIAQVGLEDSSEIVSLATTEQLRQVFDDDLWRSERPGEDETFDAERFALWLEVMMEVGEDFAATKLAELPEDLVTLALHRQVLVLDMDAELERTEDDDAERVDKVFANCLHEEFDQYQVISRRHDGWDSVVSVLATLDKNDHEFLARVLERCAHMSSEYIEDNGGLFEVLASDEMLASDLAADREDRRAAEGFIAPSRASSFLALCRSVPPAERMAAKRDPITQAYFRELAPANSPSKQLSREGRLGQSEPDGTPELERLVKQLQTDDVLENSRPAFLLEGKGRGATEDALFKHALATLKEKHPEAHSRRMDELAYLTNVLVAGCAVDGRTFRPYEAIVAVAATCNLGVEELVQETQAPGTRIERAVTLLVNLGAEKVFQSGWWLLHHRVAIAACESLSKAFAAYARREKDPELRRAYEQSAKFTREKAAQGKPTFARNRLADLPVDEPTQRVLEGLLADCPILVGDLTRPKSRRYPLDSEREFVGSKGDLTRIQAFLDAIV